MTDPRWVAAHGKQILVETLETPSMKVREAGKQQQFVKVPLQWAGDAAKATGTRGATPPPKPDPQRRSGDRRGPTARHDDPGDLRVVPLGRDG